MSPTRALARRFAPGTSHSRPDPSSVHQQIGPTVDQCEHVARFGKRGVAVTARSRCLESGSGGASPAAYASASDHEPARLSLHPRNGGAARHRAARRQKRRFIDGWLSETAVLWPGSTRLRRSLVPHRSVAPINGRIPSDAWSLALSRALRRSSNESCRNLSRTLPAIE